MSFNSIIFLTIYRNARNAPREARKVRSIQSSIVSLFRSEGALSEEKAIEMEDLDWFNVGLDEIPRPFLNVDKYVARLGIRKTSQGKYWLDVDKLMKMRRKNRKKAIVATVIFGIITVMALLFLVTLVTSLLIGFNFYDFL